MKVGVLILGEYREFKIAVKTWNFLKYPNLEYWISSWNESNQGDIKESITEADFRDYLPLSIRHIKIHSKEIQKIAGNGLPDTSQCWRYHFMYINEQLIREFAEYDYILITRPDLWYSKETPEDIDFLSDEFLSELQENTIYTLAHKESSPTFVNDILFFGKGKEMMEFLSLIQYYPVQHQNSAKIIYENFKHGDFGDNLSAFIVRPGARKYDFKKLNRRIINGIDREFCRPKINKWNNKQKGE